MTALQNPDMYPYLRRFAIHQGLASEQDLPTDFDQGLVITIIIAFRAAQQMIGQMGMGGSMGTAPMINPAELPQMRDGGVVTAGDHAAMGGKVKGAGTGTSDSIPIRVSAGEYVIPAHVVKAKGTEFFDKLLEGVEIMLETDFFQHKDEFEFMSEKIIYTGPIDRFFDFKYGKLEYRSLRWENYHLDKESFQGHPVMNFTDDETEYTRVLEHKFFDNQNQKTTYISKEYSCEYTGENDPYYPIRDEKNVITYNKYKWLADENKKYIFGGRLGTYTYYDMHQVIGQALATLDKLKWGESKESWLIKKKSGKWNKTL